MKIKKCKVDSIFLINQDLYGAVLFAKDATTIFFADL